MTSNSSDTDAVYESFGQERPQGYKVLKPVPPSEISLDDTRAPQATVVPTWRNNSHQNQARKNGSQGIGLEGTVEGMRMRYHQ